MKKLITLLLLATAGVSIKAQSSNYDFSIGSYYYKVTSELTKEVALVRNWDACIVYTGNIVIPDSVPYNNSYYKVTAIEQLVFIEARISSIVFPKWLRTIGDYAFESATFGINSATLYFPKSLNAIHNGAFSECSGIEKISIPAAVETIGLNAFTGIQSLKEIEVDARNQHFSSYDNALYSKDKTTIICCPIYKLTHTLHDSTTTIGEEAFGQCMINEIVIPSTVTTIHLRAFSKCARLNSIHIPASVSHLGGGLFKGCYNLKTITIDSLNPYYKIVDTAVYSINMDTLFSHHLASGNVEVPASVKVVAEDAFSLSKVRNVEFPEGLTEINNGAFRDAVMLRTVTLPQTLKKIGVWAFSCCEQLETIDIPNSVTSIGASAFDGCNSLRTVRMSDSVKVIPSMLFYGCISLGNYTGGNSVERMEMVAFTHTKIKSMVFPETLRVIEDQAFYYTPINSLKFTGIIDTIGRGNFGDLQTLSLVNPTPPYTYNTKVANSIFETIIPCGTTEAYMSDPNWSSYNYTEDCDGVEGNTMAAVKVTIGYRSIEVLNAENYNVAIYDVMGRCVVNEPANGNVHRHYNVPTAGVYVVRVNDKGYKVVVR